ncbi:MAG: hypothetical protein ACTSO9_15385 [Candidatus Helarchaeota archaeon]
MEINGVTSDSSFFICFYCDLQNSDYLHFFLKIYDIFLGQRIFNELPKKLHKDKKFLSKITFINYDYYQLIMPFFGSHPKHIKDGEYEAIGLAYFLNLNNNLKYLIIDEKRARNFTKRFFPELAKKQVGTIGFIRDCCCEDKKIKPNLAIEILYKIKNAVETSIKKRPCSLGKKDYRNILIPIIEKIKQGCWDV